MPNTAEAQYGCILQRKMQKIKLTLVDRLKPLRHFVLLPLTPQSMSCFSPITVEEVSILVPNLKPQNIKLDYLPIEILKSCPGVSV